MMDKMENGKNVIFLDAGDLIGKKNYRQKNIADLMFNVYEMMNCKAILPGEQELSMGSVELLKLSKKYKIPLVCANVLDKKSHQPIFDKYLIMDLEKKSVFGKRQKIGVVGIIDDTLSKQFSPDEMGNFEIIPTKDSLKEIIPYLLKKTNLIILMLRSDPLKAKEIHEEFPQIFLTINAHSVIVKHEPATVNVKDMVETPDILDVKIPKGGSLFWQNIDFDKKGKPILGDAQTTIIKNEFEEDTKIASIISAFEKNAKPEDKYTIKTEAYMTSQNCKKCHLEEFKQWVKSPHARAFDDLIPKGKEEERSCLVCHVTGAGYNMGFGDLKSTPDLINVQCEACHGPGNIHIQDNKKEYGKISINTCTACHDSKNDPSFNYNDDFKKVLHK
jgi:2',3'-cyclic-nucleotide 2'-phosphodiesterase (5'-nucleotidase family)